MMCACNWRWKRNWKMGLGFCLKNPPPTLNTLQTQNIAGYSRKLLPADDVGVRVVCTFYDVLSVCKSTGREISRKKKERRNFVFWRRPRNNSGIPCGGLASFQWIPHTTFTCFSYMRISYNFFWGSTFLFLLSMANEQQRSVR